MGGEILSSTVSLLVLLALLGGAALLAKRLRGNLPGTADGAIKLLATRPLGGANMLVLVQAEDQKFLLGVSRAGITSLGRLDGH
jgi:flagellar biogenesis protein FliO